MHGICQELHVVARQSDDDAYFPRDVSGTFHTIKFSLGLFVQDQILHKTYIW